MDESTYNEFGRLLLAERARNLPDRGGTIDGFHAHLKLLRFQAEVAAERCALAANYLRRLDCLPTSSKEPLRGQQGQWCPLVSVHTWLPVRSDRIEIRLARVERRRKWPPLPLDAYCNGVFSGAGLTRTTNTHQNNWRAKGDEAGHWREVVSVQSWKRSGVASWCPRRSTWPGCTA